MTATRSEHHRSDARWVASPRNWRRSPERGRWRWLALRLTVALVFSAITAVAAYMASDATQPATYRATAVVVATPSASRIDNEALLRTLAALATSPPVLNAASARGGLGLDDSELVSRVKVSRPPDSAVLNISSDDPSRSTSLAIANSVAAALVANSAGFSDDASTTTTTTSRIKIFTLGTATAKKIDPPLLRNALIGFGLGALISGTVLVVLGRREERLGGVDELAVDSRDVLEVPSQHPRDAATAFDLVHRALITLDDSPLHRIAVVGGSSKEESGFVVMLCAVLASLGKRVLMVDADLGSRTVTRRLHMADSPGLAELLTNGDVTSSSAWAPLPSGAIPSEILDLLPPYSPGIDFLPAGRVDVKPGLLNHHTVEMLTDPEAGADVSVIITPRVPGPYPVTSLMQSADMIFVLEVPGWTRVNEGRWRIHLVRRLSGDARVTVAVLGQTDPAAPAGQK